MEREQATVYATGGGRPGSGPGTCPHGRAREAFHRRHQRGLAQSMERTGPGAHGAGTSPSTAGPSKITEGFVERFRGRAGQHRCARAPSWSAALGLSAGHEGHDGDARFARLRERGHYLICNNLAKIHTAGAARRRGGACPPGRGGGGALPQPEQRVWFVKTPGLEGGVPQHAHDAKGSVS